MMCNLLVMSIPFKIYFINLLDRQERWDNFVSYSKFYPTYIQDCIERVDAFDSRENINFLKSLDLTLDPVSAPSTLYFSQSRGAAGCYASHYKCWQKIVSENVELALIVEDDIEPADLFNFLLSNPDLDESYELHHLGKRGFDGLEAYILNHFGAKKLINLTHNPDLFEGHALIDFSGNYAGNNPLDYKYFQEHSNYSFLGKKKSIVSAVDKFVGYSTSPSLPPELKVNCHFSPIISLCDSAFDSSDIELENFGNSFNNMNEFEINQLVGSEDYMWWDPRPKQLHYPTSENQIYLNKKLTICVCTYNNYAILKSCLHYLSEKLQNSTAEDYDVLVLDNTIEEKLPPFNDSTFSEIIKKCENEPNFKYIHEETEGLSGARNRCVELANTDLIHFIDDDSLAHPNFVTETLNCFNKYKELHVLGGKTLANWGDYGRPPWLGENLLGLLSMLDLGNEEIPFNELPPNKQWFVGANICFTKESILKYGGFDTSLGRKGTTNSLLGGEENELLHKISKENLAIYCPSVVVDHLVSRDRLDQSWFLKRIGWQSVSEIMANDTWIDKQYGIDQFIKDNINYLSEDCYTEDCFNNKMKLVQFLVFKLLNNGELK